MEEDKIPTAEALVKEHWGFNDTDMKQLKESLYKDNLIDLNNIFEVMRMYAEVHVKAALEAACENATCSQTTELDLSAGEDENGDLPYAYEVDKKSIINAYPLTNIK